MHPLPDACACREWSQPGCDARPEAAGVALVFVAEAPQLLDHRADRELPGAGARGRLVSVHEKELVDAIGGSGQEVASEAERVPVAGVETGDGPPPHSIDLVGDGDTRHGGPSDVVVGDEVRGGHLAEHADLVPDVHQVGPGRRLDLTDPLEGPLAHPEQAIHGHGRWGLAVKVWKWMCHCRTPKDISLVLSRVDLDETLARPAPGRRLYVCGAGPIRGRCASRRRGHLKAKSGGRTTTTVAAQRAKTGR